MARPARPTPAHPSGGAGPFLPALLAVALVGLGARVWFVLERRPRLGLRFDPALYHLLGVNLARGLGYVRPPQLNPVGARGATAEFGPLLPGLLAVVTKLGLGTIGEHALVTALLGGVTVFVVGLFGRRIGGPAVGLVAAALVAVHPLLVQVDGVLVSESPYLLLVAGCLLVLVTATESPTPWRWALAGALAGLAALARAEGLVLLAVVVVPAAWTSSWPDRRRALVAVGLAVAATAVVVLPWTVRNWARFDAVVPVSNNVGSVVLGANCPSTYAGRAVGSWDFGCIAAFAAADGANRVGPHHDEAAVYGRWRAEGTGYLRAHPAALLRVVPARLLRTAGLWWHPTQQLDFDVQAEGRDRTLQTAGAVLALVLLPLAVLGGVAIRRRRRDLLVLLGPVVVVLAMSALTFGTTRFRTAAEPSIAVLASLAIVRVSGSFARRRRGGRMLASEGVVQVRPRRPGPSPLSR